MIEPIEELRKTAGDALAESMEAGYKALVESQHTRRAVLVNMLFNKAYAAIQNWLAEAKKAMRTAYMSINQYMGPNGDYNEALVKSIHNVDGAYNMLEYGSVNIPVVEAKTAFACRITKEPPRPHEKYGLLVELLFTHDDMHGQYSSTLGTCYVQMRSLLSRMLEQNIFIKGTLAHNAAVSLLEKCNRLGNEKNGWLDNPQLNIVAEMINTENFKATLRHEITHHIQYIEGAEFSIPYFIDIFDKYELPPDYKKFHDVVPEEIDAELQAQIPELFREYRAGGDITKIAKYLYDYYMKHRMNFSGYGNALTDKARAAMSKQCWETAVSMARAIVMGYRGKPWDTPRDEIIKHMDDYAV